MPYRAAPEISPTSPPRPVALWAALADAAGAAGTSSAPTLTLPKPSSKDDFERRRRVGELRPLAGCVQASFAAVYQRERSLGYWAAGETPLPPDMVKKIKAKSPAA